MLRGSAFRTLRKPVSASEYLPTFKALTAESKVRLVTCRGAPIRELETKTRIAVMMNARGFMTSLLVSTWHGSAFMRHCHFDFFREERTGRVHCHKTRPVKNLAILEIEFAAKLRLPRISR